VRIQSELATTFIYVTRAQEEALSMGGRIMLMNDGERVQIGTPSELYSQPANEFVADFIGDTNFFESTVQNVSNGSVDLSLEEIETSISAIRHTVGASRGDTVTLSLRPESIQLATEETAGGIRGEITAVTYYGKATRFLVDVNGKEVLVEVTGQGHEQNISMNDPVSLQFDTDDVAIVGA
jgi:ABC-type Fe3+/spermidine/putrescine transport system ATPase subunit